MNRFIDLNLKKWSQDPSRKPLLLRGARQVGKTFAVRQLGKSFTNFVEINFESHPAAKSVFEKDLDPKRIIRDLNLMMKKNIVPGKTLLFFDEIQEIPRGIIALRYFYEELPEQHIIAAGSLLDFAIAKVGVPVGRISFLYLYPLSWLEFLKALGYDLWIEEILNHNIQNPFDENIHQTILQVVGEYLAIGGMPEVVKKWAETKNPQSCAEIHHSILESYQQDFHKYATKHQIQYISQLFEEVPRQLGQKFKYSLIQGEYRKRELSPCLELLEMAGVVRKIFHSAGQGIPLGAESSLDQFKVLFLDVGLSQALLGLDIADWFLNPMQALINKGGLVETFVGQEILAYSDSMRKGSLYYWQRESKGSEAEVDYLIQKNQNVIPIEVKSGQGSTLKSMRLFLESHPRSPYGIRFSTHNYSVYDHIHSYPLYAVGSVIMTNPDVVFEYYAS